MKKDPKICKLALLIPSRSEWHADFALSVTSMLLAMARHALPGYDANQVTIHNKRGSLLPALRQQLLDEAMSEDVDADYALFLDSDMFFPPQVAHMMIRWQKPVVACNCATKAEPASPTARVKGDGEQLKTGIPLFARVEDKGILEVWRIGAAVMLIDLKAIKPLKKPHFLITWDEERQDFYGEDWYFCSKLEEAGIPIHVELELSKFIGHIGDKTYSHDDVLVPEPAPGEQIQ